MTALLILIYIAFISLGLPDSMLGASWPEMRLTMNVPIDIVGYVAMITAGGTIVSSLMSNYLIRKLGTGKVLIISVTLTAAALLMYSYADSFLVVCLLALPLGLGGGSVDAALNNYVALNYEARHMNWLHCFWGIGATVSPLIMGICMNAGSWEYGFRTVSIIQFCLVGALLFSLPMWARGGKTGASDTRGEYISNSKAARLPGAWLALVTFFCFVGFESTAGVWVATYLTEKKELAAPIAATVSSLYFLGTTVGRLASGFISIKISSIKMIRFSIITACAAAVIIILPLNAYVTAAGFLLLGLGNAALYPSMISLTPERFGRDNSQAVMGLQMASAYVGSTFMPPLASLLARQFSLDVVPVMILILTFAGLVFSELLRRATRALK